MFNGIFRGGGHSPFGSKIHTKNKSNMDVDCGLKLIKRFSLVLLKMHGRKLENGNIITIFYLLYNSSYRSEPFIELYTKIIIPLNRIFLNIQFLCYINIMNL
jgi:hypothetical protein